MTITNRIAAAAGFAALAATPALADDGQWVFSTGIDYTNGDYGETEDTTIWIVPVSAAYVRGRWSASLTVPYVRLEGPGTIVPGGAGFGGSGGTVGGLLDGLLGGGADSTTTTTGPVEESGLGDVAAALSFTPIHTESDTKLTLTGRVRAPTADADRSLGTGEASAAIAAGLRQGVAGWAAVYGSLGYQRAFESQADGMFASAGAEGYLTDRLLMGAGVDWSEASSELLRDSTKANLYAGFDATGKVRLVGYASAGLSDTAPDAGAGVRVIWKP